MTQFATLRTDWQDNAEYVLTGSMLRGLCVGANRSRISVGDGLVSEVNESGTFIARDDPEEPRSKIIANITGAGSEPGYYKWEARVWHAISGWVTPTGFVATHTTHGEAYEMNKAVRVPKGQIVELFNVLHPVTVSSSSSAPVIPQYYFYSTPSGVRSFKIMSSLATGIDDSNGNPVQWTYTVTEVQKMTAGYGGWAGIDDGAPVISVPPPEPDEGVSYTGYNFLEDANTGVGRQQNGINHDGDYPPNFQMYPLQDDSIHPGVFLVEQANGNVEVWLMPYSAEDGTCT